MTGCRVVASSVSLCLAYLFWTGLAVCQAEPYDELRTMPESFIDAQVAKSPDRHATRIVAGFVHFDAGRFSKAEQQFATAVRLSPDDPYDRAWLYMAQLRRNPKVSDKAIRSFMKRKASKEFIYTNIGVLLGDIPLAQAVERARASGDPGNLCEAYYYVAQRLLAIGEVEKAREYLAKAIKTNLRDYWEYKSAVAWSDNLYVKK